MAVVARLNSNSVICVQAKKDNMCPREISLPKDLTVHCFL